MQGVSCHRPKRTLVTGAVTAVIALALFAASARAADDVASPADASADAVDAVVVHGFRKSLGEARALKKDSTIVADVIVAEDMAKFPDLNLAESLQRLPGVAPPGGTPGRPSIFRFSDLSSCRFRRPSCVL